MRRSAVFAGPVQLVSDLWSAARQSVRTGPGFAPLPPRDRTPPRADPAARSTLPAPDAPGAGRLHVSPERGHATAPSVARIARLVHPEPTLQGCLDRLLFRGRTFQHRQVAHRWYQWLSESYMAPAAQAVPALYKKIVRPYFTPAWDGARKLEVLQEHYDFLSRRLAPEAFHRMFQFPGHPLLDIAGHDGREFRLYLAYDSRCGKEGDLTLQLFTGTPAVRVCSLTAVVLARADDAHELAIGCVQGLPAGADKNIIRDAAKSLHGLRPKALLLFAAQQLAATWGLAGIRGISNRLHISRHRDYALNASRRPELRYDEFWVESGGEPAPDGFYDLPLHPPRRDLSEVKPNKRSLYRQRNALLDDLAARLHTALSCAVQHGN